MSNLVQVKVPDIGDYKDVPVIEVNVKVGDTVAVEQSLVTLESDKATMDVPSPVAGVVKAVHVKVGDAVSEGVLVLEVESGAAASAAASAPAAAPAAALVASTPSTAPAAASSINVSVPDIGDYKGVPVIEIHVKVGDTVKAEDALVTLESDKATMEVPAPSAGVVQEIKVKLGDAVSEGDVIIVLQGGAVAAPAAASAPTPAATPAAVAPVATSAPAPAAQAAPASTPATPSESAKRSHASPSVRKFARELGVDVSLVTGTGPKNRITQADVQAFIKGVMSGQKAGGASAAAGGGVTGGGELNLLPWPKVDFAKFGEVENQPLSRIKKISGANLSRNWVMIPHVTVNENADVTELEKFRVQSNKDYEKQGIKFSMLAFMIKAVVATLKKFPEFNASLDGDNLVLKKYYHIGFAADTPNGLMVPVLKDADKKGVAQIAEEMASLAKQARDGKLKPADMQGGCFTISSLGGIGGTSFTPIINAPEVAILGVMKSSMQPVWNGSAFEPRLICPLCLSFDHRVIDGAAAARFNAYLASVLADFRKVLM